MALVVLAAVASGCATTSPEERTDDVFATLYEGESPARFGTSFPVASAAEAEARGDAAARNGDLDEAIFEYVRGLRVAEKPSADMLYKIGVIHDQRENAALAALAYRWALRVDPEHKPAATRVGVMLLRNRKYAEARRYLRPIVEGGWPLWVAHNGMGVLSDLRGDHRQAAIHYRDALLFNPDSPLVMNNLGYSLYMEGDWDGAEAMLQKALRIRGDYELAWRNLALVWARKGDYPEAIEALERTSSIEEAYNDLGYVEMMDGNYPVATRFFHQAMEASPRYYETAAANSRRSERLMRAKNALEME